MLDASLLRPSRPFGTAPTDLDVDFETTAPPQLVTEVLHRCVQHDQAPADLWELAVGDRLALLLGVARWSGLAALDVVARCRECHELMEVSLSLDEILDAHERAGRSPHADVDTHGAALRLRRPSGLDQLAWQRAESHERADPIGLMVRTLAVTGDPGPGPLPETTVAAVDRALNSLDPLVDPDVSLVCPGCATVTVERLDLQARALDYLHRCQRALLHQVHFLARAYHWSEEEVLRIPAWRRSRYLALIERDAEGAMSWPT